MIHFLLRAGEVSHGQRRRRAGDLDLAGRRAAGAVDRRWTSQAGEVLRLGPDLSGQDRFEANGAGRALAGGPLLKATWTLVGCVVAPAFRFEALHSGPAGLAPGKLG